MSDNNVNESNIEDLAVTIIDCPCCGKAIADAYEECPYCKYELHKDIIENPKENKIINRIKNIRKSTLGTFSAVLLILVCSLWGVDASQDNSINDLKIDVATLTETCDDLKTRNSYLQENLDTANSQLKEYKDQQDKIDELTQQLSDLQTQYETLKSENDSLKEQITTLQTQNSNSSNTRSGGRLPIAGTSSSDNSEVGAMVWISETGEKYHSIPNCGKMNPNKASQMSKSSADASGYTACNKCF